MGTGLVISVVALSAQIRMPQGAVVADFVRNLLGTPLIHVRVVVVWQDGRQVALPLALPAVVPFLLWLRTLHTPLLTVVVGLHTVAPWLLVVKTHQIRSVVLWLCPPLIGYERLGCRLVRVPTLLGSHRRRPSVVGDKGRRLQFLVVLLVALVLAIMPLMGPLRSFVNALTRIV